MDIRPYHPARSRKSRTSRRLKSSFSLSRASERRLGRASAEVLIADHLRTAGLSETAWPTRCRAPFGPISRAGRTLSYPKVFIGYAARRTTRFEKQLEISRRSHWGSQFTLSLPESEPSSFQLWMSTPICPIATAQRRSPSCRSIDVVDPGVPPPVVEHALPAGRGGERRRCGGRPGNERRRREHESARPDRPPARPLTPILVEDASRWGLPPSSFFNHADPVALELPGKALKSRGRSSSQGHAFPPPRRANFLFLWPACAPCRRRDAVRSGRGSRRRLPSPSTACPQPSQAPPEPSRGRASCPGDTATRRPG